MKTFNVYKHPTKDTLAVKVGFSWPALFFGWIWMLVKKLWGLAGGWFSAYIILSLIQKGIDLSDGGTVQLAIQMVFAAAYFTLWLVPGFKGNKWVEDNLTERGYEKFTTLKAENPSAAVAQVAKMS